VKNNLYQSKKNIYNKKFGVTNPPSYPNEMLVKICSSKKYSNLTNNIFSKKLKICEIGCLTGNNLRFFLDKNHEVHGVEINKYLIKLCKENIKKFKLKNKPKIHLGNNLNIPINDCSLDLLIAINTIHYSFGDESNLALENYSRVLKRKGIAIIETPAPNHILFKKSDKIKDLKYRFKLPSNDHRNGIYVGLFNDAKHFKKKLKKYFKKVEINRRTENYKNLTLDFYVAVCQR
jgi:SAM-dependent methyltransferase